MEKSVFTDLFKTVVRITRILWFHFCYERLFPEKLCLFVIFRARTCLWHGTDRLKFTKHLVHSFLTVSDQISFRNFEFATSQLSRKVKLYSIINDKESVLWQRWRTLSYYSRIIDSIIPYINDGDSIRIAEATCFPSCLLALEKEILSRINSSSFFSAMIRKISCYLYPRENLRDSSDKSNHSRRKS